MKKQKNLSKKVSKQRNILFFLPNGLVLLTILFLITGCTTNNEKIPPPYFSQDIVSSEYIFNHLSLRAKKIYNVKSFTRTTFIKKETQQSVRQTLLIKGSRSMRVDTFGMFGQALGVFISTEGKMQFLDPAKDRVYSGSEVKRLLWKLLGTTIDFHQHLRIFIGHIPNLEFWRVEKSRLNSDKSKYIFFATDLKTGCEVRLDIDSMTLLPIEMTCSKDRAIRYYAKWQEYKKIGSIDWPHLITLGFPKRQEIINIKFQNPVLNGKISPEAFLLMSASSKKHK